jgi:hypothetical protein
MVNSRRKGQTAERKLVKLFEAWWGAKFFRTPGSGAFATRGFAGMDTTSMAGDLITDDKTFPFCVESKKVEGWTLEQLLTSKKTHLHKWWEQAVNETPKGKIPLLVFTKNHAPLYAMLRRTDVHLAVISAAAGAVFDTSVNDIPVSIFALDHLFTTQKGHWIYDRNDL